MGKIYRYSRPYREEPDLIDGYENYFSKAKKVNGKLALLDSGINPISKNKLLTGSCIPAILISSSPHKIGSQDTPWQDLFEPDHGRIKYFGDNKTINNPEKSPGNKTLLAQFLLHTSPEKNKRKLATPILFFQRQIVNDKRKGFLKFQGLAIITSAELITQYQEKIGYFTNYVYEFTVLDLSKENEEFNWEWIKQRGVNNNLDKLSLDYAPKSWNTWIETGNSSIEKIQRKVNKFQISKAKDQIPISGSREEKCLSQIYSYYQSNQHRFEFLALKAVQGIINRNGGKFVHGWVTKRSSDGGVDFVGRLDFGSGFSQTKIIVLGQAKCENPKSPTSGKDISRTVARLKRGWIGAYVTTSFFSEQAQIEINEDQFPLMTVNGNELAKEILIQVQESGFNSTLNYLDFLDSQYSESISNNRPEEILQLD